MDFLYILLMSVLLFLAFLLPIVVKRIHLDIRHKKELDEYIRLYCSSNKNSGLDGR